VTAMIIFLPIVDRYSVNAHIDRITPCRVASRPGASHRSTRGGVFEFS
jgi:hypothetical protein